MERIGRFELIQLLGEGFSSEVFLALDPLDQSQVAIKRFRSELLHDPLHARAQRQQLVTEAALARRLRHPHIARVHDVAIGETSASLVMEYVPGGTLEQFCSVESLLPFERVVEILFKCTRALDYAFRRGVTHRDIKPSNIMLREAGSNDIRITDFGAAQLQNPQHTVVVGLGSPAYMSPEQMREEALTHQTDIYSLGVVMYQLLTGRLPFEATHNLSLAWQIDNATPTPPSQLRADLPTALDDIVRRAMHRSLALRYGSWQEFAHDLAQVSHDLRSPNHEAPPPETQRFQRMRAMPFFRDFDDVELWEALHLAQWRRVSAGSLVMREGESGDCFAILADGHASICSRGQALYRLQLGECFGEMAVVSPARGTRSADVIADSDCSLLVVAAEALTHASTNCQVRFYRAFMETLASRLANANERIVKP